MTLGAWGVPGAKRRSFKNLFFYLMKTMVFEVRRPRGRPQIQKKRAPKPSQKTGLKIMRFFYEFGSQNGAQLGPNSHPKSAKK